MVVRRLKCRPSSAKGSSGYGFTISAPLWDLIPNASGSMAAREHLTIITLQQIWNFEGSRRCLFLLAVAASTGSVEAVLEATLDEWGE